jgi:DNA-binding transcriptional LysR family regulator
MIDSDRLSSFIAFAEELYFTRAAARLHLSQPALHVQIKKLADDVGAPLYRRVGRSLQLTAPGRELLGFARELRERTEAFLSALGGGGPQRVTLAAGEGTLLYNLGPAIRKAAQLPGVKLRVLTRDREGTLAALASAEAHLGVTALEVVPDDLEARLLRRAGMRLVMPPGHPLTRKRRVKLAELQGERLIVPPPGHRHRQVIARALESAGVGWEVALEANGWELMLHYAALGMGLAIVNDTCRIPRSAQSRPLAGIPSVSYHVLHGRRIGLSEPAQVVRRLIIEAFSDHSSFTRYT